MFVPTSASFQAFVLFLSASRVLPSSQFPFPLPIRSTPSDCNNTRMWSAIETILVRVWPVSTCIGHTAVDGQRGNRPVKLDRMIGNRNRNHRILSAYMLSLTDCDMIRKAYHDNLRCLGICKSGTVWIRRNAKLVINHQTKISAWRIRLTHIKINSIHISRWGRSRVILSHRHVISPVTGIMQITR